MTNDLSREVFWRVDDLRRRRGYSMRTLSEELQRRGHKITETMLHTLKARDVSRITVEHLVGFAHVLGVSLDDLVYGTDGCRVCHDQPPVGMTCNRCGTSTLEAE